MPGPVGAGLYIFMYLYAFLEFSSTAVLVEKEERRLIYFIAVPVCVGC